MSDLVGLNSQTPDVFGKLGQLLNLRHAAAQAQMAQQDATQRKNIAAYDWQQHVGPDGVLDVQSFASDPDAPHIFGDKYVDYLEHAAVARQQGLAAIDKLRSLRSEQRKDLASFLGSLRSDQDVAEDKPGADGRQETGPGRQKANEAVINFVKTYGADALPIAETYGPVLKHTPPGQLANSIKNIQLNALSADQQVSAQQPGYTSTGDKLKNVNPNVVAGAGGDLNLSIPPGAMVATDANGRQYIVNPQNPSKPRLVGGAGGASPNAPPSAPTFVQPVAGQHELEQHVNEVRKADSDYGTNRHVNDELLRLSSNTSTGPGSALWHTGAIGKITGTFGGNAAADYQKIGAYLDRQAAMSAKQMGLPDTNAGLQTAASLSGTTDYTPEALQTKVKLSDAMVEGAHQYRKGLDKVVGTGPNQDLAKLQTFRSQWADNFDPYVFRVENALRRGDKAELATIKNEIGADGMAQLKEKSENLRKLEAGELLP